LSLTLLSLLCVDPLPAADAKEKGKSLEAYRSAGSKPGGNAAGGRTVFEGPKAKCASCHAIGGETRKAGPDLLGIADKYRRHELVEHMLHPDKSILAGYATSVFVTKDAKVHTGVIEDRQPTHVDLFIASGEKVRLASDDIASEKAGKNSLMPKGLWQELSEQEFVDLTAYVETLKDPDLYKLAGAATPEKIGPTKKPVRLVPIIGDNLRFGHPVWFEPLPGVENAFVVVENDPAKVWVLEITPTETKKSLFLDFKKEAHTGQHMGLMGLAFHPKFLENRKYYLNHHYLEGKAFGTYVIERQATKDYRRDAAVASRRLIRIPQNTILHTGGMIGFGPDGFLYIGTGDGGPQTDPNGRSQKASILSGSILRIDVDRKDEGLEYGIPKSNPFVGSKDPRVRGEVWAIGLRQAWRFSWDPETDDLWVGDVGQVRFEEITIVRAGENHGWNVYEGFLPFSDRYKSKASSYVAPVVALGRRHGASVTGGYVYRGKRSPGYRGVYIFGDYESKRLWGLTQKDRQLTKILEIGRAPDRMTTFALDRDGEIYFLGYDHGLIYRLDFGKQKFE